jgi:hypothetical protein
MPKAAWNGAVVAESDHTIKPEGNDSFPPESVRREYVAESKTQAAARGWDWPAITTSWPTARPTGMAHGVSRPNAALEEIDRYLTDHEIGHAVVTTPEGEFIGLAGGDDAHRRHAGSAAS